MDHRRLFRASVTVAVIERGHTELTRSVWDVLRDSASFWRLVESKVLGVTALSDGRARLDGSNLVGRAVCEGTTIEFREKIPGALLSLLGAASPSLKAVVVAAPLTELGPLVALLARAYVDEVRAYVGRGREWIYESQRRKSSSVGGRMNVSETMRLRAAGLRHLVSFDRQIISHSTAMNRLLYAGLREVELLASVIPLGDRVLSGARAMSLFFEDCRDSATIFRADQDLAKSAEDLRESGDYESHDTMLALAAVLLSHSSFEPGATIPGVAPFSWFVNLADLFETAVRERLSYLVADGVEVAAGRTSRLMVFPEVSALNAAPDIVIKSPVGTVIGDVKYKNWSGTAEASDLYQLLVHARAFNAGLAFLVFPSDRYAAIPMGQSVTWCETWLFSIDVRDLDDGLNRACAAMSIITRGLPEVEEDASVGA